jgi:hypothetical protein
VFRFNGSFEKLAEYKGVELINECQVELPLTYGFVSHTSGQKSPKKHFLTSSLLNSWIPMLKFIYRNNVILAAGGCKKTEIKTFHDLGKSLYECIFYHHTESVLLAYDDRGNLQLWGRLFKAGLA